MCIICVAVVGEAMRASERAKLIGVKRKKEGTNDRALRDPVVGLTRAGHRPSQSYPEGL